MAFIDDLVSATTRAFQSGDSGVDTLTFMPTLDPWEQHLWGQGDVAASSKPQVAGKRPGIEQMGEAVASKPGVDPFAQQDRPAHYGKPRRPPTSGIGNWESVYENGKIPTSAMVSIGGSYLEANAAASWRRMDQAARADGVQITIGGGYRTYAAQVQCVQDKGLYSQGGLCATPGTSEHGWGLAVDNIGDAGNAWLARNGGRFGWEGISGESWHFNYTGEVSQTTRPADGREPLHPKRYARDAPKTRVPLGTIVDPSLIGVGQGDLDWVPQLEGPAAFAHATANAQLAARSGAVTPERFGSGTKAQIKAQLYQGFMDAGHPELAKMVKTKAFDTWIAAESGWRVDSVSQVYAGHGRNFGLFQFWDGHEWTNDYYQSGAWTASAYEQAKMAARYFNLTPQDIRTYATQINGGNYQGWG